MIMPKKPRKSNERGKPKTKFQGSKEMRRDVEIDDTAARDYRELRSEGYRPDRMKNRPMGTKPNSPSWAGRNPQLVKDVASIPFGVALGSKTDLGTVDNITGTEFIVPGVFVSYFMPSIGYSDDLTSPINVAARNIISDIRKDNSGKTNYDSADMMMYLVAKDQLDMFYYMCRRAYGVLTTYTPYNRYYARTLIRMMGFDPIDLELNAAAFRALINIIATKCSNLATPNNIPIFERHKFMTDGLYVDSASKKAQTYMFMPTHFWAFDNTSSTGSSLVPVMWFENEKQLKGGTMSDKHYVTSFIKSGGHGVSEVQSIFEQLYQGIMLDEDFATMSGDILKAYSPNATIKLSPVPSDYLVTPQFSEEVLSEIENMNVLIAFNDQKITYQNTVTQNPSVNNGAIVSKPGISHTYSSSLTADINFSEVERLLNFHWDSPSPDDVMTATSMRTIAKRVYDSTSATETYTILASGTEIVLGALIAVTPYGVTSHTGGTDVYEMDVIPFITDRVLSTSLTSTALDTIGTLLAAAENFDWCPGIYMYADLGTSEAADVYLSGVMQDLDVYATIANNVLIPIHEARLLSIFSVG